MGLYYTYRRLYDLIESVETKSKITLTPALRREIFDLYVQKVIKTNMTPQETIDFIELHPRKLNRPIRPLRRFTKEEQEARRKKSEALNKAHSDYIIEQAELTHYYINKKGMKFDREHQQFFVIPRSGATREQIKEINQFNDEVAFLFNKNEDWSKYSAEENKQFARRRSVIMLSRLTECFDNIMTIPKLVNENLPTGELVKNYRPAISACNLYNCIEAFCTEAQNDFTQQAGYYDFTEAEIKQLFTFRPLIANAGTYQNQVMLMANPVYAYLDINGLEDYELDMTGDVHGDYGVLQSNDGEEEALSDDIRKFYHKLESRGHVDNMSRMLQTEKDIQNVFFERHKNDFTPGMTKAMVKFFDYVKQENFLNSVAEENSDFLSDYGFMYELAHYEATDKYNQIRQDYLMGDNSGVRRYGEQNTQNGLKFLEDTNQVRLYEGVPVALEKNGRVIILTPNQSNGLGGATEDKPESLFNYALKMQHTAYTRKLKDADPLLVKSSPEYKEMQKALADVGKLTELAPGQSTANAYRKFQRLLNSTEIYLRHKKDGITEDEDRSSVELRRVKAARELKEFALAKLKELELTNQARETLQKYKDMEPDARKEAIAAEDARTAKLQQAAAAAKAARNNQAEQEKAPLDWFEKQMNMSSRKAAVPEQLQEVVSSQLKLLKNELVPDTDEASNHFYEDFSVYQPQLPIQLAHTLGGMLATELMLQERSGLKPGEVGPLEAFFSREGGNASENSPLYQSLLYLGKDALKKLLPKKDFSHMEEPGAVTLSEHEVKHVLENFHPSEYIVPGAAAEFAEKHIYPVELFEKDYTGLVPAGLEQAVKKDTGELKAKDGFYPEKKDTFTKASIRHLAGSLVAAELISREREMLNNGKPGPIENELIAEGTQGLQRLGEKSLQLCTDKDNGNALNPAGDEAAMDSSILFRLDTTKLTDQLTEGFRKEHGLISPLEESLTEQYCSSVKPLRGEALDDYEQTLVGYANMQIIEPLKKYGADPAIITDEDSRRILSSCALCSMVKMERVKSGAQPGMMESLLLKDPGQFEAIRHNIELSPDFNQLLSSALTPGGMPVSSLTYLTKLLKDTGLVVNIIDNTKKAIQKNQPGQEKGKEKEKAKAKAPAAKAPLPGLH